MSINITKYNIICNLGNNTNEVYKKAIDGNSSCFELSTDLIQDKTIRLGKINIDLPEIGDSDYNLRCNKLILKCLEPLNIKNLIEKYGKENIGIVVATTNTGVEEFENTKNLKHAQISNPAEFVKNYFKLNNYYASVSTACSSGIKAFSIAQDLLNNDYAKSVIVIGVDTLTKVPIFGFNSLGILSETPTNPFSKNRCGINIGEGVCAFILEKNINTGIEIIGIGETTDIYHATTPEPNGIEAIKSIEEALKEAHLKPDDIDYINLHGTGTNSNDSMEANVINKIFGENVLASSTKPLTGHCLGAASGIETALCCKLLETQPNKVYPHIYDNIYDETIPKIKLASKTDKLLEINYCLCLSFGFGGTNTAIILKRIL